MHIHPLRRILPALLILALTGPAAGSNVSWLDGSAARYFTDRDWELFTTTLQKALDEGREGQRFDWENPESRSSGYLIPRAAGPAFAGRECRLLETENRARGYTGNSRHTLCRGSDGAWKIVR